MFDIKIDDARYWKSCVDSIVNLIDEGTFNITKEGINLKALDPFSISMVSFNIPNKAFSKYEVEKSVSVGLNLENLGKILSSSRQGESLVMKESTGKLLLEFIGPHSKRRYKLPIIEVKKGGEKELNIEFESIVEVKSDSLREILKDASLLSKHVGFSTDKESFKVIAKGDAGELEEEHVNNADAVKKMKVTKPSSVSFDLDYLERMISACPAGTTMTLSIKSEDPIKVDYNIGDAQVSYFLAPYMES
jgi:proliferating cell nuclear antigen